MNITYLMFLHDNPYKANDLINRLNGEGCDFFVHVDKKSNDDFHLLSLFPNVHFATTNYSIDWGGITMVEALLECLKELLVVCKGDMICFLSGYDYPAKSNEYIRYYLEKYREYCFVSAVPLLSDACNWHEHGRRRIACYALRLNKKSIATIEPHCFNFSNIRQFIKVLRDSPKSIFRALCILLLYPRRVHPEYLIPYGGEFWWVLPRFALEKIITYVEKHPDFKMYHNDTSNPDELFIPTLVYNLFPKKMIIGSCLRYIHWRHEPSPGLITMKESELLKQIIVAKDVLFARKISDKDVCRFIDNEINKLI